MSFIPPDHRPASTGVTPPEFVGPLQPPPYSRRTFTSQKLNHILLPAASSRLFHFLKNLTSVGEGCEPDGEARRCKYRRRCRRPGDEQFHYGRAITVLTAAGREKGQALRPHSDRQFCICISLSHKYMKPHAATDTGLVKAGPDPGVSWAWSGFIDPVIS